MVTIKVHQESNKTDVREGKNAYFLLFYIKKHI